MKTITIARYLEFTHSGFCEYL